MVVVDVGGSGVRDTLIHRCRHGAEVAAARVEVRGFDAARRLVETVRAAAVEHDAHERRVPRRVVA